MWGLGGYDGVETIFCLQMFIHAQTSASFMFRY